MTPLHYLLITLIPFLGLGVGFFVAHSAREELSSMLPTLQRLQPLLFLVSLFIISFAMSQWSFIVVLVLVAIFLLLFWKQRLGHVLELSVLAILFVFSSLDTTIFFYFTLSVFLFSMVSGVMFFVSQYDAKLFKAHKSIFSYKHDGRKHNTIKKQVAKLYLSHVFFLVLVVLTYVASLLVL